ncbi:hypothetical protein L596_003477 [Steinernema carpocapsae]|uniref:Nephrin n=1 Tax=Steinernema carpocapsae TaxID=34508 RepID=A0A4U8USR4_STECR|nr:hypothetical protein L596_003477 [Steinernema carpocapsae]
MEVSDNFAQRDAPVCKDFIKPTVINFVNYRQSDAIEISEDQAINITCVVPNVKPAPKIDWYINGKLIADNNVNYEKYNLNKTVTSYSSLYWKPSKADHKKVLTCQANHPLTSTSLRASVSLSVLYSSERPRVSVIGDDQNVRAGQNVSLLCSVIGGNPLPDVSWHFNRHHIESISYYDVATLETVNRYSFIADANDNGAEYECRSSNRNNVAPLRGSIRLKVTFPPSGIDIFGNSSVRQGERAFVTCRTKPSNPASKISISINGAPSRDPEQYEEVVSNGFVTVTNFTVNMNDIHVKGHQIVVDCAARNAEGSTLKQHIIRVLAPPMQPLVYGFEHDPVYEGDRLNLTCESHGGNPLATLSWYRGVEKLKESRSTVTGDVSQSHISIPLDRTLNRVPIRCEASNDALDSPFIASKKVVVLFPPKKVHIRPQNSQQMHTLAGETANLVCLSSSSNPESEIEWKFPGKPVQWQSETVQNKSSGEFYGFEVENVVKFKATEDLNGFTVFCTASHPYWTESKTATYTLNVLFAPRIAVDGVLNINIGEGESFRENLTVFANPPISSWRWRRNGIPFEDTVGSIFARGAMLTGRSVTRNDAGIYSIYASNSVGTSNATIRLSVEFPARVTHITSPVIASIGEDVELECVVEAFPRKKGMVRWFKDGAEMPAVIRDERRAALRLNASEQTSGDYLCIADNGLGSPHIEKAFLLVNKAPRISRQPAFARAAAALGSRAKMVCRADAVPGCTFNWQLESTGEYINSNTTKYAISQQTVDMDTFESILHISNIEQNDYTQRLRCIASNRYGRDEMFLPVGPLTTPDLPFEITVLNTTVDSLTLSWLPGFDGGSPQLFEVQYSVVGGEAEYRSINTSDSTLSISGLPAGKQISIQLRSINHHGYHSDFSAPIRGVTLSANGVDTSTVGENDEEYPKFMMIIFGVGLFTLCLVNCLLLAYLHRRQKIKKIQEKTEIVRTHHANDDGVRHVQMYGTMALTPQDMTRRAESEMTSRCEQPLNEHCGSEDDHSVRTMIEVNPNGYVQQLGTPFFDSNCLVDYEFDPALYSDIVRHAPHESSYPLGPYLDECPSIDGTLPHELFAEFATTSRQDTGSILDSPLKNSKRDMGYHYQPSSSHASVSCGTISGRSTHSLSTFIQPGGVRTAATNYSVLDGDLV